MAIPETQLQEWSQQGDTAPALAALAEVQRALAGVDIKRFGRPEVFLAGPFANDTNIASETDADIDVLFRDTFYPNVSALNAHDRAIYERERTTGRFSIADARTHVLTLLTAQLGEDNVRLGEKAIRVDSAGPCAAANVVAACGHKHFYTFPSKPAARFVEGIVFADASGAEVVNYPQQHLANGQTKQQAASGFKPLVRVFKNLARWLEEQGRLQPGTAPPYFIECFVYSVPNTCFYTSKESSVLSILIQWSTTRSRWDELLQQNQVVKLFGAQPVQWDKDKAGQFLDACQSAWDGWS